MFFDDYSSTDLNSIIEKWINENKPIDKSSNVFDKWFELSKENLKVKYDSILVFEEIYFDAYEDNGDCINGIPLFKLISMEDSDDPNTKVCILDVKIPYNLDVNYNTRLDDTTKYCIFTLENLSNLFKSNMSEQNVDNSFTAVKELLDGKFNLLRQLNYEEIPFVLSEICSKNSIKGFQLLIYELMTMALSRELNDSTKEFRHIAKNHESYDKFQMINVREVSRSNSAFSALASENISKSILTALTQSKAEKQKEIITPQEQIALGKY